MSAIFLKIMNLAISASWLIVAVIVVRLLLKKSPRWISCLLWGLVAIRLICPFSMESALSLIPSGEVVPADIVVDQRPQIDSGMRVIDNAVNPVIESSFAPSVENSVNPMQVVVYAASIVWIMGLVGMCIYAFVSYVLLRKRVGATVAVSGNVRECDEVQSPFILGIFRPLIYVPSGMKGETLDLVIAHEEAHLKRKDHWWKPLGFVLLSVYWFNPLCWVAYILLCRDIEAACDEKVIRDKDREYVAAYSQALLDCSIQRRSIAACPLAFGETGVKERVKSVLNYRKPAFWVVVVAVVACIVIAVCFMTNPKDDPNDLSLLNYRNAISLIVQDGLKSVISYPEDTNEKIKSVTANSEDVVHYFENVDWKRRSQLSEVPASEGAIEFVIDDEYRIIVYKDPQVARVVCANDDRYYKIQSGDYEAALSLLKPYTENEKTAVDESQEDASVREREIELMEIIRENYPDIVDVSAHLEEQNGQIESANVRIVYDEMIESDLQIK